MPASYLTGLIPPPLPDTHERFLEVSSFNSKLRDELLDGEVFYSLAEARVVIESWRRHYNTSRPHSALGYRPPAPEVVLGPARPTTRTVAPRPWS
jgi:hypothetical protein